MERGEAIKILMGYNYTPEERAALEALIPELAESEDDRIRQKIIGHLEMLKNGCVICVIDTSEEIAWLEKQKEKLSISCGHENDTEWSEEDKRAIDRACVALRAYSNGELPEFMPSELRGYADRLQSLRPQPRKEIYQAAKHNLAIKFMNYLDENRPEGKMSLSNGECEDIDKAFKENDWAKIIRYIEKYSSHNSRN